MSIPTGVNKITADIALGSVLQEPWTYVVLLSLTIVGIALRALLSAYFRKRGETLATKADFAALQSQLQASTRIAEEIKGDIQTRYGEQASLRLALREKTELLVMTTFELEDWLTHNEKKPLSGEQVIVVGSPMAKISALRDIYFHEIGSEFFALGIAYHAYVEWILEYQRLILRGSAQSDEAITHVNTFQGIYEGFLGSLGPFRARVIQVARSRGGL